MKNKSIGLFAKVIPYHPCLNEVSGSPLSSILMQQLEYWFVRNPNGFYKFLARCPNHQDYRIGDSWVEELGFSKDIFRTAFDNIGIRYQSKKEYDDAIDKFQGKFYCSYHDKIKGKTFYFRNHNLTDSAIDLLTYGDKKSQSTEEGDPNLHYNTENISEITSNKKDQDKKSEVAQMKADFKAWWELYPKKVSKADAEKAYIKALTEKEVTPQVLTDGLKRYIAYLQQKNSEPDFISHASSWLNKERWNDEYQTDLPKSPETNPPTTFIDQKINKPMHGLYRANKDMFVIMEQGVLTGYIGAGGAEAHANNEKLPIYDDQLEESVLQLLREEYKRMKEGDKR